MRLLLITLSFFLANFALAQPAERAAHGLIVKLKEGTREGAQLADAPARRERLHAMLADAGLAVAHTRPVGTGAQHLDFGRVLLPAEAEQLMARIAARPEVEWVAPNVRERRLQAANPPNDPLFRASAGNAGQWWLYAQGGSNMSAIGDRRRGVPGFQTAWAATTGGPAIVAVLDTGIARGHPDLGRVLDGYDFVSDAAFANDGDGRDANPADPGDWVSQADRTNNPGRFAMPGNECVIEDSSWHGTNISGLIVAATDNSAGVAGINWDGRVLAVRVAGKCGAAVTDILDGMRWAAGLSVAGVPTINPTPARVLSISFGSSEPCEPYQATIDELARMGVVVVAAAGNEQSTPVRPARCPGVIGVGAVNRDGFKTNYSNFGPELTIATVGGDLGRDGAWGNLLGDPGLLTVNNEGLTIPGRNDYAYLYGTSFSAPLVAGAISLMLSVQPGLTHAQIIDGLKRSARPHVVSQHIGNCSAQNFGRCICTTGTCGAGLLDAGQAVLYAQNPATYTPPARQAENIDSAEVREAAARGPDEGGAPPSPAPPPTNTVGDGGGGALDAGWLLALALAALALARLNARRLRGPR